MSMRVLSLCVLLSTVAFANEKQAIIKEDKKNYSFEDLLVQGKYHFQDEAVTTVEQDKVLDGLLSVRPDFKDRIVQSAELK